MELISPTDVKITETAKNARSVLKELSFFWMNAVKLLHTMYTGLEGISITVLKNFATTLIDK